MLVCATILPDWFAFDTALYPNGSSLKLAVGTSTATLTSSSTPESLAVNAATQAPVRLWTVQNLAPTMNNVVLSTTDVLDMSATLMFQNPMLFPPLSSVFITGAFGFNRLRLHAGVDLRASDGTPVFNVLYGTAQNQFDPAHPGTCSGQPTPLGYGANLLMTHANGNFQTRYAHLQSSQVSDGI